MDLNVCDRSYNVKSNMTQHMKPHGPKPGEAELQCTDAAKTVAVAPSKADLSWVDSEKAEAAVKKAGGEMWKGQKIEESIGCVFVKINTHSMAQGKKSGAPLGVGGPTPSSNIQDAVIQRTSVKGRDVLYELKITIDDGYLINELTFGQFELIHRRIQNLFIDSALPSFPSWFQMSFTPARKMSVLNKYLKQLFEGPCKGNEYVCTLFTDGPDKVQQTLDKEARPQIQLNLSYKDCKLSVLIKHLKNIKYSSGSNPDTYVVTRLRPDPRLRSKRKTKVVRNNDNPTFNELIEYNNVTNDVVYGMVLEVTVKSKKKFVGATSIKLEEDLLNKEQWFPLGSCEV